METDDRLDRGRKAYARREWLDAYGALTSADRGATLGADDLERMATSASMLGHDDDHLLILERAHHAHVQASNVLPAARCACWLGITLLIRGETGAATGWLGRAQRMVDREPGDCAEQGYLLIPSMMGLAEEGELDAAYAAALEVGRIGERFDDADLVALALHQQGRVLTKLGRIEQGLALLDETMLAVTGGELSPMVTGLIYCSVIEGCQQVYELRRAQEWTAALTRWCAEQPDMVSFTGRCLVHRAEIMQLGGAWPDALEEAGRAGERFARAMRQAAAGEAAYRQGEIHRLQGRFAAAEEAYRDASRCGFEPQPGRALLRLAQGSGKAAAGAMRRILGEATDPLRRAGLLPVHVEVMLAVGDLDEARRACRELEQITEKHRGGMLGAMVAHARGAVALADGEAWAALVWLRQACASWHDLEAPYEAARVRVLVGLACRALGDEDTAALELEAAREAFEQLGAQPDLALMETHAPASRDAHGLTARELQVLRLVAAGESNKAIAASLVISDRTVDRHVSNIFTKLRVASRAAATAFAYEHQLV